MDYCNNTKTVFYKTIVKGIIQEVLTYLLAFTVRIIWYK